MPCDGSSHELLPNDGPAGTRLPTVRFGSDSTMADRSGSSAGHSAAASCGTDCGTDRRPDGSPGPGPTSVPRATPKWPQLALFRLIGPLFSPAGSLNLPQNSLLFLLPFLTVTHEYIYINAVAKAVFKPENRKNTLLSRPVRARLPTQPTSRTLCRHFWADRERGAPDRRILTGRL
jgi:hypothetical protein